MLRCLTVDLGHHSWGVLDIEWSLDEGPLHLGLLRSHIRQGRRDVSVIGRGPLAGRPVVGAAVAQIAGVSPVAGAVAEAKVEGPLAHALLALGLDAIMMHSVSSAPMTIRVSAREQLKVEFLDCAEWSDETVFSFDARLRRSEDEVISVTGPWGMSGHPAASVVTNCGFPTSQGGLGAVWGGLGVKAIVLTPSDGLSGPSSLERDITEKYAASIDANPLTKSEHDYPGFGLWLSEDAVGYAGSDGFRGRPVSGLMDFDATKFSPFAVDSGTSACPGCPQSCLKSYLVDPSDPVDGGRVHQLGIAAMAAQSDTTDPEELLRFNALCHDWGVEHLAAEESLRASSSTSGLLETRLETALQAHPLGSGLEERVKGMVIPPFEPRTNQGLAVGYALNPSGPRYDVLEHDIDFDPEGVGPERSEVGREWGVPEGGLPIGTLGDNRHLSILSLWTLWSGLDALGVCEFAAPPTRELSVADITQLAGHHHGATVTHEDLHRWGRVRLALMRDTNAHLGIDSSADRLPERFFSEPLPAGKWQGSAISRGEFESAAAFVREGLSWNEAGIDPSSDVSRAIERGDNILDRQREGAQR